MKHPRPCRRPGWLLLTVALSLNLVHVASAEADAARPIGDADDLTGRIAYSTADGVWVMNADGSNRRQVTHPGDQHADYDPAWSPDGTTIAFRSSRATPPDSIMLVDVDGANERSLAVLAGLPEGSGMAQAGWSPDGRKLVFTCNCPANTFAYGPFGGLYTTNADGSGLTKLNDDGQYPDWSPDGAKIAYIADRDGNEEIYTVRPDGTGLTRITDTPGGEEFPVWTPDGKRIAFASHRDGNYEIYVMNADGTDQRNLTNDPARDASATWSPDGTKIAFDSERGPDADREAGIGFEFDIWVMNADGTGQAALTADPASEDRFPAWSGDGRICFNRIGELYVIEADGSNGAPLGNARPIDGQFPDWLR